MVKCKKIICCVLVVVFLFGGCTQRDGARFVGQGSKDALTESSIVEREEHEEFISEEEARRADIKLLNAYPVVLDENISIAPIRSQEELEEYTFVLRQKDGFFELSLSGDGFTESVYIKDGLVIIYNRVVFCFLDTVSSELSDFTLEFVEPQNPFELTNIVYLQDGCQFVVIYNVFLPVRRDGNVIYNDAYISIQTFSSLGVVDKMIDNICYPSLGFDGTKSCEHITYGEHYLSFSIGTLERQYVVLDIWTGTYMTTKINQIYLQDDMHLIVLYDYLSGYTFQLHEYGQLIRETVLPLEVIHYEDTGYGHLVKEWDCITGNIVFENDVVTFYLDLNDEVWIEEAMNKKWHFTPDNQEIYLTTSSDGRYELYIINSRGYAGEMEDLVIYDKMTEEERYLLIGKSFWFTPTLVWDDLLIWGDSAGLQILNIETGTQKEFHEKNYKADNTFICGFQYDWANECLLVAWRDHNQDGDSNNDKKPISLDVYDQSGQLLRTLKSDLETPEHVKYFYIHVGLELDGKGNVTIEYSYDSDTLYYLG